ncbi:helix-turn-helix domain-containing protein [Rickettsiales endosymbiont of Stachyamoeba lipophora]|uniref:helix-turn-helix domain-containing protein n=1 Tax=Rickettsiales endosymbiont of Stachyamoeba lipophora TaxID=2486578 RepID=UPI000F64A3B8|nr:helix-turn-helix transcriptional regulator [Rickettsiales endosymbiont of Stachyamoeba lipophora]AZL15927.1 XRE family transcriptional regulator [Rickettsiales endosymbiont of Stachyamoeba lipophora]
MTLNRTKLEKNYGCMADILKKLIHKHNMSIAKLSRATNITAACLYNILDAAHTPRLDSIISLAEHFEITIGQLLGMEPLNKEISDNEDTGLISVPLIDDDKYQDIILNNKGINNIQSKYLISKTLPDIILAYQLKQDYYSPFTSGAILIISLPIFIKNNDILLIDIKSILTLKIVATENNTFFFKSLAESKVEEMGNYKIIGIVKKIIQT